MDSVCAAFPARLDDDDREARDVNRPLCSMPVKGDHHARGQNAELEAGGAQRHDDETFRGSVDGKDSEVGAIFGALTWMEVLKWLV